MEHPYVPRDLHLPGYVPGSSSPSTLVGVFLVASLFGVSLVWIVSERLRTVSKLDRLLMCWYAFSGPTHMIVEGYFLFSPEFYKDNTKSYLAEVWKEYSKTDSRYLSRDTVVVTFEGIFVLLIGPACLLAVYAIAKGKAYSYILQFAISLSMLNGILIYYVSAFLDGDNFATSPYYYYAYNVFANFFWVLIPSLIVVRCWKKICLAVQGQTQKKNKIR